MGSKRGRKGCLGSESGYVRIGKSRDNVEVTIRSLLAWGERRERRVGGLEGKRISQDTEKREQRKENENKK